MGIGGISIWQLLIVLVIVLLLFGTKRLRNIGSDLGNAVKGFRKAVDEKTGNSDDADKSSEQLAQNASNAAGKQEKVIDGEATRDKDKA